MKKEFKVRSMPSTYYVLVFLALAVAASITFRFHNFGWVFFIAPLIICIQSLHAKIVIDKGYLFVQGTLATQQRIRIELIRKVTIERKGNIKVTYSRGFACFDPADANAVVQALVQENPAIVIA